VEENCKLLLKVAEGSKYLCPPHDRQTSILILKSNGTGSFEVDENEI
jgi:hypothetical protein